MTIELSFETRQLPQYQTASSSIQSYAMVRLNMDNQREVVRKPLHKDQSRKSLTMKKIPLDGSLVLKSVEYQNQIWQCRIRQKFAHGSKGDACQEDSSGGRDRDTPSREPHPFSIDRANPAAIIKRSLFNHPFPKSPASSNPSFDRPTTPQPPQITPKPR
jgi:hypothetical protein